MFGGEIKYWVSCRRKKIATRTKSSGILWSRKVFWHVNLLFSPDATTFSTIVSLPSSKISTHFLHSILFNRLIMKISPVPSAYFFFCFLFQAHSSVCLFPPNIGSSFVNFLFHRLFSPWI